MIEPDEMCQNARITVDTSRLLNMLKVVFMRYLPNPTNLQDAVNDLGLKLSDFDEDEMAKVERTSLDERIKAVRDSARSLIKALDIDEEKPLNTAWLRELQEREGLPTDDPIV